MFMRYKIHIMYTYCTHLLRNAHLLLDIFFILNHYCSSVNCKNPYLVMPSWWHHGKFFSLHDKSHNFLFFLNICTWNIAYKIVVTEFQNVSYDRNEIIFPYNEYVKIIYLCNFSYYILSNVPNVKQKQRSRTVEYFNKFWK